MYLKNTNRPLGRSRKTRGIKDHIASSMKWLTLSSSEKRKKNDDYDMEGGRRTSIDVPAQDWSTAKKVLKGIPHTELAAVVVIVLLILAGLYGMVHGLTSSFANAPIVGMYEPTDSNVEMVSKMFAMYDNKEHEKLEEMVEYQIKHTCKEQLPFSMGEEASLVFHGHIMDMIRFMGMGGDIKTLAEGHVVVGDDGAIYALENNSHDAGTYSSCDLVNALVWYNHHKQVAHTMEDTAEQWGETYKHWESEHAGVITGNVDHDARILMRLIRQQKLFDFELDFHHAVKTHCGHIMDALNGDRRQHFISHGTQIFEMIANGLMGSVQHPQLVVTMEGNVQLHDEHETLHSKQHMTCPLLDKALHYRPKALNDQVEGMLEEMRNGDMFGAELSIDALIDEHCQGVKANADEHKLRNFHGHLADFAYSIAHGYHMGGNDFVATRDGEVMHRIAATSRGLSPSQLLTCPLLNALSKKGDHSQAMDNEDRFTDKSSQYQTEREELTTNKYSLNPAHDVQTLVRHKRNNELHDFDMFMWDVLEAYHGKVLSGMDKATKDILHHRFSYLVQAVADGTPIESTKQLLFSKLDGEVYYADDMQLSEMQDMVQSPILDELLKHTTFLDTVMSDYQKSAHRDPKLTAEVEKLFEASYSGDWYTIRQWISEKLSTYCETALNKLAGDPNAEERRLVEGDMMFLVNFIQQKHFTPTNAVGVIQKNGNIGIFNSENKPSDALTCPLLDEILLFGQAMNKQLDKSTSQRKEDEELLTSHLKNTHQHHEAQSIRHDVTYLIKQAQGNSADDLDGDIYDALKEHCPDFDSKLLYKAKATVQGHVLQIVKRLALGGKLDMKISDPVLTKSGHIESEAAARADGKKYFQCPLVKELFTRA